MIIKIKLKKDLPYQAIRYVIDISDKHNPLDSFLIWSTKVRTTVGKRTKVIASS